MSTFTPDSSYQLILNLFSTYKNFEEGAEVAEKMGALKYCKEHLPKIVSHDISIFEHDVNDHRII